jgi:arsenate reductase
VTTLVFVCVHNAGRSQMAAAFFNAMANPMLAGAVSAGTQPAAKVHATVVAVMAERGIDLSAALPQRLTSELLDGTQWLITMGCGDDGGVYGIRRDDWPTPDPANQSLEAVRGIALEIENRVWKLVVREGWVRLQPRGVMRALHARRLVR